MMLTATSGTTLTLTIKDGWNYRFTNLSVGSTYSIEEDSPVPGSFTFKEAKATATNGATPATVTGQKADGTVDKSNSQYTVAYTNVIEITEAEATKAWKNADDSTTAPEGAKVTFTLYEDGKATEYTVELDGTADTAPTGIGGYESAAWTAKFINLRKLNEKGEEIKYTIAETTEYPGYTKSPETPVASGGTITNEQNETAVSAVKAWKSLHIILIGIK